MLLHYSGLYPAARIIKAYITDLSEELLAGIVVLTAMATARLWDNREFVQATPLAQTRLVSYELKWHAYQKDVGHMYAKECAVTFTHYVKLSVIFGIWLAKPHSTITQINHLVNDQVK